MIRTPLYLSILLLLACKLTDAQTVMQSFSIASKKNIYNSIPKKDIYLFPNFEHGTIIYRDGKTDTGKFNIDGFYHCLEQLSPNGDTIIVGNDKLIRRIIFNRDTILRGIKYFRRLYGNKQAQVLELVYFGFSYKEKDKRSNTWKNDYQAINKNIMSRDFKAELPMKIVKLNELVLVDSSGKNFDLTKDAVLIFFEGDNNIDQYVQKNNIDLNNREQVEMMFRDLKRSYNN